MAVWQNGKSKISILQNINLEIVLSKYISAGHRALSNFNFCSIKVFYDRTSDRPI
jgi:hypothetical protein